MRRSPALNPHPPSNSTSLKLQSYHPHHRTP
uniref:Uncharacterized protein n=1 Tax=Rhizophora mucronata TaxID=61149 RepID=A0A2P2J228_RHIMU